MAKKEKLKYCLWSYNKEEINDVMMALDKLGIESFRESHLHLKIHLLLVNKKNYDQTITFARENLDPKKIGMVNDYGVRRHLYAHSLVLATVKEDKKLDSGWEREGMQPHFIREMLENLKHSCNCILKIRVNTNTHAIEIYANGNNENYDETRDKIISYIYENMGDIFESASKCEDNGRLIKKDKTRKRDNVYHLFDRTFLASGMYNPGGNSIVPKTDEELLTESGYISDSVNRGCQRQKQTIVLKNDEKIVINGVAELYEVKKYTHTWDAERQSKNEILPVESSLIDHIKYNTSIVFDKDVAKLTTNFTTNRDTAINRELAFGLTFPSEVSSRNAILPFPLKAGNYNGVIEEYFMRSTDGTKLLHFATHSPYFEIYDIPEDFDFVNNNLALNKASTVYDIRDYNPEEPELQSVRTIIDNNLKQLMLSNKDN